ncbi:MAG: hypothetical protein A2W29_08435 [Gemmatimonadetes bacterium RBG_16_66_8]|nr:MAG: hypothetical protein A2W29_08435 [Gemmatimonadetes bacterium RBG_16_66_8]
MGGMSMAVNVGWRDAAIRWTLAVVLFGVALVFHDALVLTLGSALVGMVLAGTAATRSCPFYTILGRRTDERRRRQARPAR